MSDGNLTSGTPIVHMVTPQGNIVYSNSFYVTWTDGEFVRISPMEPEDGLNSHQVKISEVTEFDTEPFKMFFANKEQI